MNNTFNNMIQNGYFGVNSPQNFVFQPLGYNNYYNPYASQYESYYNNGVTLSPYQNMGYTPLQYNQLIQNQEKNIRLKEQFMCSALNLDYEEEKRKALQRRQQYFQQYHYYPQKQISYEDMMAQEDMNKIAMFYHYSKPENNYISNNDIFIQQLNEVNDKFKELYGDYSMYEFMNNGSFEKLAEAQWILANCSPRDDKNLSRTYNSNDYNELLNMHRSSNPYVNQLLNTSQYDNNIDDLELGSPSSIYELIMRRRSRLQDPVPTSISDAEVQMHRHNWTNSILDQIYNKNGGR